MAERDGTEKLQPLGNTELGADPIRRVEHRKEERAETGVVGGKQERHRGEGSVDGPVRRLPRVGSGTETGVGFVRFCIALHVGIGIGEGERDDRGGQQRRPGKRGTLLSGQRQVPERCRVVTVENEHRPSLGLA